MQTKNISFCASALALALALAVGSCGGSKENAEARQLLEQSRQAVDEGNFALAQALVDSLQKTFPSELGLVRESMTLRPQIIEKETERRMTTVDSLIAVNEASAERLKPQMKWVKTPGMIEGYWIAKGSYNPSFLNTTGIQGRVSEIGQFYVVSSLNPGGAKHTSVSLSGAGGSVATPSVAYDGDSNFRLGGGEMITFTPEQSDTLGYFAAANPSAPLSVSFIGRSTKKIKLSASQTRDLATAYEYSRAIVDTRELEVEKERLNRTLQTARDQQARLSYGSSSEENVEEKSRN